MTKNLLIALFTRAVLLLAILTAIACQHEEPVKYGGPLAPYGRSGAIWYQGNGSPEGVVGAPVGSIYSRKDGGIGTTVYYKVSGTGNTGWISGSSIDGWKIIAGTPVANHGTLLTGSKNGFGAITSIGAFTSVTLTYSTAYTNDSICTTTPLATGTSEVIAMSAHSGSVATFSCLNSTTGAAANCVDFMYICYGR